MNLYNKTTVIEPLAFNAQDKTLRRLKAIENISYLCSSLFLFDLNTLLQNILKPFCELSEADYGLVVLLQTPENIIQLGASYGFPENFTPNYNRLNFKFYSNDVSENWPSVKSMLGRQIVLVKDTTFSSIGFSDFFQESINPNKIKSVASVPLIINDRAVGALTKYYINNHDFNEEEMSFMKATANIITSTIEKNQLVEASTKSQKELAEAYEELKIANKELDSFVHIASHDLREPLRTIESFINILKDKLNGKLSTEDETHLLRITKATQKMRCLIQDLTNLSRVGRNNFQEENDSIDLNKLLTEVIFELTASIEKKKAIINFPENLPLVKGNKSKISSVFKNIISNGIKFNKSENPTITIKELFFQDTSKVCLVFEDNGIGINKDFYNKIFNLFERLHTQEEYEGTGAGLAIVKKILAKYGCNIWLESNENKGSKFFITLLKYL